MRKLYADLFIGVDGVVEMSDGWTFPYHGPELARFLQDSASEVGTILTGRRTYQQMGAYWPTISADDDPIAGYLNATPKVVVSSSLTPAEATWGPATVISGDVAGQVAELKQQPGTHIAVPGSATLVRLLLRERLVDQLRLIVFPLLLGGGARLFDDWTERTPLRLVSSRTFSNGVVVLAYEPEA